MSIDPKLKEELKDYINDQIEEKVKSIQVKYLKENFLTRDEFLEAMERMDKRFEAMDKRFEAMQKQIDKRFEVMQKQIDNRFERVYDRFDKIDLGYGVVAEGIGYDIIKREFRHRGIDLDLQIRQHFQDKNKTVHPDTEDVEIDIFHMNPNILGEATLRLTELEKVRTFIKKIDFLEKIYNTKFERYFITLKIDDPLKTELEILLKKFNIELIIPMGAQD